MYISAAYGPSDEIVTENDGVAALVTHRGISDCYTNELGVRCFPNLSMYISVYRHFLENCSLLRPNYNKARQYQSLIEPHQFLTMGGSELKVVDIKILS